MESIRNFKELYSYLDTVKDKKRIAFVHPYDEQTLSAVLRALKSELIVPYLIGEKRKIEKILAPLLTDEYKELSYIICPVSDPYKASDYAVAMAKNNEADAIMKGLVNTDIILKAVLNRDTGIAPHGNVITFVAAIEIPTYHKFIFISDPAVIPAPNLRQFQEMIKYCIELTGKFGIDAPKIALIHATEKKSLKMRGMQEYIDLMIMHENEPFGNAVVDGPMDIFIAINKEMGQVKEVNTPILGDADVLIFPSIEAGNVFYKSAMTFGGAQMGGMLFGTEKPVIITSRSDSADSKFNSIALACLFS